MLLLPAWCSGVVLLVTLAAGQPPQTRERLPQLDAERFPPAARAAIGRAVDEARARPEDARAAGRLAIVLHAWEQWDAAAAVYAHTRRLAPETADWWYLNGLLEASRGQQAEAATLLARAVELAPAYLPARIALAEALLQSGSLDRAEPIFRGLAREAAAAPAAAYGLGRILSARGEQEAAIDQFTTATRLFPDFGAAHYALALAYRRLGRAEAAQEALDRHRTCMRIWPAVDDPVAAPIAAARDDATARLKRGTALAGEGETEKAIAEHEAALTLNPDLTLAHTNLIALYGRAQQWPQAEAHYRAALAQKSNLGEAHANYAQVLLTQRRSAEAIDACRQALAINPQDAITQNVLGLALELSGRGAEAHDAFREAVAKDPTLRAARFNYARTLVAQQQFAPAIAEFERLQAPEDADTPRYRYALAAALVRAGEVERGRQIAGEALRLAQKYQQPDLVAAIERSLSTLR